MPSGKQNFQGCYSKEERDGGGARLHLQRGIRIASAHSRLAGTWPLSTNGVWNRGAARGYLAHTENLGPGFFFVLPAEIGLLN